MGKAKTSKKQKSFSVDDLPITSVKGPVERHDPQEFFRDRKKVMEALSECMIDGDTETAKEIVREFYEAQNITQALKRVGVSRRTFYQATSENGNPRLDTFMQLVHGMVSRSRSTLKRA